MHESIDDYITTAQAAEILNIDPKSASYLAKIGTIPGIKVEK